MTGSASPGTSTSWLAEPACCSSITKTANRSASGRRVSLVRQGSQSRSIRRLELGELHLRKPHELVPEVVFGGGALDLVEIDFDILSAHRGQAGDPVVDARAVGWKNLQAGCRKEGLRTTC
jgi:hypothetical protein